MIARRILIIATSIIYYFLLAHLLSILQRKGLVSHVSKNKNKGSLRQVLEAPIQKHTGEEATSAELLQGL